MTQALLATWVAGWLHYGGDLDGRRFANIPITPENVSSLEHAWTTHTDDASNGDGFFGRPTTFKATPILVDDALIVSTAFNRVLAVDARSGSIRWRFDPGVDFEVRYSEMFTSRGVSVWRGTSERCSTRIFLGTLDARLLAIDASTGTRCKDFGNEGEVDLSNGIANFRRGEYSVTSPPTVVSDLVVVGSSIGDNGAAKLESGAVRAYDARTGSLKWRFDPLPDDSEVGGANVWSVMSADPKRDLIFLPTTSPSPDFFGGHRLGTTGHANAIVALRASTGALVWSYTVVKHDLWDYDLASQPLLIDWPTSQGRRPALAQATKMGFVFVLDRETGEPLVDVEERPVPASDVPGERAAATQRFSRIQLHPMDKKMPKLWRADPKHADLCRHMLRGVRFEGPFTPPSREGTLVYPGNPGGTNWGSMASDGRLMFTAVNRLPTVVKLIPRKDFRRLAKHETLNGVKAQFTEMTGTPFGMARFDLYDRETGRFCFEGPWAQLVAMEVGTGRVVWSAPAGRYPLASPSDTVARWGYFAHGGPLVTRGGVIFLADSFNQTLTGYNASTGRVVWQGSLPFGAHATPMAFQLDGVSYVAIAAGGDNRERSKRGDALVVFRLGKG